MCCQWASTPRSAASSDAASTGVRTRSLAGSQGLVGIAAISVVLDSAVNATDSVVEAGTAQDLEPEAVLGEDRQQGGWRGCSVGGYALGRRSSSVSSWCRR